MGGTYYPEKDKHRRVVRYRRRHYSSKWWYRTFCSSSLRMAITTALLLYLTIWHVLLPLFELVLTYGSSSSLSSSSMGSILRGKDLLLLVHHDEENAPFATTASWANFIQNFDQWYASSSAVQQYNLAREQAQLHTAQERIHLLAKLDRKFFHRNDIPVDVDQDTVGHSEPEQANLGPNNNNNNNQHKKDEKIEQQQQRKDKTVPPEQQQPHPSPPPRILRTLDNMQDFVNKTHCPLHLSEQDIQITLVIQASLNRIRVLQETCTRWKDPIVVVLAVLPDRENIDTVTALHEHYRQLCPHVEWVIHTMQGDEQDSEMYPVNFLRNLGLDRVQTSHVMVFDVDFVPSDNLADTVRTVLQEQKLWQQYHHHPLKDNKSPHDKGQKHALVVPAFERILTPPCTTDEGCLQHLLHNSSFIPHSFDELATCYKSGDCIVFQSNINPAGHSSTRSVHWLQKQWYDDEMTFPEENGENKKQQETRTLHRPRHLDCFDSARYEPYLVIRWCPATTTDSQQQNYPIAPFYDERFHGYGKNKIEHVQHLRMMGYRFSVLPKGFIVHNPHVESKVKQRWNNIEDSDLHRDMDHLYRKFLEELFDKYYDEIGNGVVETCKHGQLQ